MSIHALPIWVIFAATMVAVLAAIEGGRLLGQVVQRRSEAEKESPVSAIAGTILGLSGFMLAFTFGMVADRHANKRALVREDAVVILTAWKRADFLPEPDRAEAATLLREYVDLRVNFAQERSLDPDRVAAALAASDSVQARLWNMAVANARLDMNSDVAALYIEALNEMSGLHSVRVAVAMQARVPPAIWLTLYFITILGMVSVGYQTAVANSRRSVTWPILALSFSLVFTLIASLDQPDSGVITVTQRPLLDLRDAMDAQLAAEVRKGFP